MTLDPRISLITLGVADVARATGFYEKLGWKRTSGDDNISFFQLNGIVLGLYGREALAEDAGVGNTPPGFSGVTLAYNTRLRTGDRRSLSTRAGPQAQRRSSNPKRCSGAAIRAISPTRTGTCGKFAYNPFSPLDDNGHMIVSS